MREPVGLLVSSALCRAQERRQPEAGVSAALGDLRTLEVPAVVGGCSQGTQA